ncbi:unnamed protein product [Pleuronectes platessa]|uniref:Uncharacterized protein n=1 Tax=Pleuronectes platessa TaxID=8262 RepID=A0A9N7U772_PLEPL|nr:unnamed protein product [Pleuronectes platessa]
MSLHVPLSLPREQLSAYHAAVSPATPPPPRRPALSLAPGKLMATLVRPVFPHRTDHEDDGVVLVTVQTPPPVMQQYRGAVGALGALVGAAPRAFGRQWLVLVKSSKWPGRVLPKPPASVQNQLTFRLAFLPLVLAALPAGGLLAAREKEAAALHRPGSTSPCARPPPDIKLGSLTGKCLMDSGVQDGPRPESSVYIRVMHVQHQLKQRRDFHQLV